MIHHVVSVQNQFRDGHDGVALMDEMLHDVGQSFRGMECGIVEEDDAPRLYPRGDTVKNRGRIVILPVQGIPKCNKVKPLCRNGLRDFDGAIQVSDF